MRRSRWHVIKYRGLRRIAVVPIRDLRRHRKLSARCWCAPRVENESGWRLIVHNALDGRELVETLGLQ